MDSSIRTDGLYFLKRNPLFTQMGEEVLGHLVQALRPLSLEKGASLFREGDLSDAMYLLQSGRVRIVSKSDAGEDKTLAFLGRGDAVGELSLLTGEPQVFGVLCDSACDFFVLTKPDFDAVLEGHPLIGIHLSRALSRRLAVSFHPPKDKPKAPQVITLIPGTPHETTILYTVNLGIALVEQTRRKVLLLDAGPRSGDLAHALGLVSPQTPEALFRADDLPDISVLHRLITVHPSGLEILSLHPRLLRSDLLSAIPSLLGILKDHYDFTLILSSPEKDILAQTLVQEADKAMLVTWDQAADAGGAARNTLDDLLRAHAIPVVRVALEHADKPSPDAADFRVPWTEAFHQPFRETGAPYLNSAQASSALAAIERVARGLGKLRIGLAMGSGASYGYALIGLLKVFEREGIPVDIVAGTSMGALLGSFFCAGLSPDKIQNVANTITKKWLLGNIFGDLTLPHSGFLSGQTLNAFLRSVLGNVEFHQLPIPFAAVATDIRSGHEVVLKEGRVVDAVRASTSLPILFAPFLHKGRYLVDGGLVNPVPTSTVASMGADILISVNLTAKPSVRRGLGRYRRVFPLVPRSPRMTEVFFKMIYTMQYEIAQARTEIAHVVIAPDMRDYLWTDFHRAAEIAKVGEAATEEAVAKIKTLLPYHSDYCKMPSGISLRAY